MERDSHWSDHTDQKSGQQPDKDPWLSTRSQETGQQSDQDPSQSTGNLEIGQQPEDDLIQEHPFTLEGNQGLQKTGVYSQYLEDSLYSRHSGTTLHQSPVRNSKKEQDTDRRL